MVTTPSKNAGWARPDGSRKDHYFTQWSTESLCGSWSWFNQLHDTSEAQCKKCATELAKTIPADEPAPEPVEETIIEPDDEPEPAPEDDEVLEAAPVNMREQNLRLLLIKAFADALGGFLKESRDEHLALLLQKWQDDGNKSFDVMLPDGTKVGTVGLNQGKSEPEVVDQSALLAYAEEHDAVDVRIEPEVVIPSKTVKTVNPAWFTKLLKNAIEGDDGDLVDLETGETIPGVKKHRAPDPNSFTVRYEKDGREKIALAYKRGELSNLTTETPLPAITGGN